MSSALIAATALWTPHVYAKGSPQKHDFVTKTHDEGYWNGWTFETTGTLSNDGTVSVVETWTDDDGTEWARYRFTSYESNYFETVLPTQPDKSAKYDFVLTAGPNGFWTYHDTDLVLYEGDWAYGKASARVRRRTFWWDGWEFYYDSVEWSLNALLMP